MQTLVKNGLSNISDDPNKIDHIRNAVRETIMFTLQNLFVSHPNIEEITIVDEHNNNHIIVSKLQFTKQDLKRIKEFIDSATYIITSYDTSNTVISWEFLFLYGDHYMYVSDSTRI